MFLNMLNFDIKIFSERLKELREAKGISQDNLAAELNLTNSSVSRWENGLQQPTISALFKLAQFFEISGDYLIGLEN